MLHITGTPFAIAPSVHCSGKASDLDHMKADSAEDFSNAGLRASIALPVTQRFVVPFQVPESNRGMVVDLDSHTQIQASNKTAAVLQILVGFRTQALLHSRVECHTAVLQMPVGYHTAGYSCSAGYHTATDQLPAGYHTAVHH